VLGFRRLSRYSDAMQRPYSSILALLFVVGLAGLREANAQAAIQERITVIGQEVPSAYGAPPGFSRARFSPTVTAYVLPPGSVLAATIYDGMALRREKADHRITQEFEVGLPHRINLAMETELQAFAGVTQATFVSLEARWALADWNKLPLNPTIFGEYRFGVGDLLHDERTPDVGTPEEEMPAEELKLRLAKLTGPRKHHAKISRRQGRQEEEPPPGEEEEGEEFRRELPDAVEGRLLLAQDFFERVEWAMDWFIEQETSGDRGREWGFAQAIVTPLTRNETFKLGVEMLYRNFTDKDTRDDPQHTFIIGPTVAWKPSRWSRLDVSPLFGLTAPAPHAEVFVVFSMLFGGGPEVGAEAPASVRNR
jgi:hypothetical protein